MWRSGTNSRADDRLLTAGVLAAVLVLHAAMIGLVNPVREPPESSRTRMTVTFASVGRVEEAVAEDEPLSSRRRAPSKESAEAVVEPEHSPDPTPEPAATPQPPGPDDAVPESESASTPEVPGEKVERDSLTVDDGGYSEGHAAVRSAAVDYRALIVGRLEEKKVYPAAARTRGLEGPVTLSFIVLPDGTVTALSVEGRETHRFLRQAAMETVRKTTPFLFPTAPPSEIRIRVTIEYRLED